MKVDVNYPQIIRSPTVMQCNATALLQSLVNWLAALLLDEVPSGVAQYVRQHDKVLSTMPFQWTKHNEVSPPLVTMFLKHYYIIPLNCAPNYRLQNDHKVETVPLWNSFNSCIYVTFVRVGFIARLLDCISFIQMRPT